MELYQLDEVTPDMRVYREEIFGPVVRVPDLNAAIALINHHEYANGTALFTGNGAAEAVPIPSQ